MNANLPQQDCRQTQAERKCCVRVQLLPIPHLGRQKRLIDRDDKMPIWSRDSSHIGTLALRCADSKAERPGSLCPG